MAERDVKRHWLRSQREAAGQRYNAARDALDAAARAGDWDRVPELARVTAREANAGAAAATELGRLEQEGPA